MPVEDINEHANFAHCQIEDIPFDKALPDITDEEWKLLLQFNPEHNFVLL